MKSLTFILILFLSVSVYSQDSVKVQKRDRDNYQKKEMIKDKNQIKEQKQIRQKFIDMNCDGINDSQEIKFHNRIKQHNDNKMFNQNKHKNNQRK